MTFWRFWGPLFSLCFYPISFEPFLSHTSPLTFHNVKNKWQLQKLKKQVLRNNKKTRNKKKWTNKKVRVFFFAKMSVQGFVFRVLGFWGFWVFGFGVFGLWL